MQQIIITTIDKIKMVPEHIWILLVATTTYVIYRGATLKEAAMMFASSFLLGPFIGDMINKFLLKMEFEVGTSSIAYTFAAVLSYNLLERLIKQSPALSEKIFNKISDKI
jgi:hypothetical protein